MFLIDINKTKSFNVELTETIDKISHICSKTNTVLENKLLLIPISIIKNPVPADWEATAIGMVMTGNKFNELGRVKMNISQDKKAL